MKFGKLTVQEWCEKKKSWLCSCECGGQTYARSWALKTGRHTSCKCGITASRPDKRLPDNLGLKRDIMRGYVTAAERRGYKFNISEELFCTLILQNCAYCNSEPQTKYNIAPSKKYKHNRVLMYNGIDRVDNTIGYLESNIVPCCEKCNMAKRDMSIQEFKEWVVKLYNNMIKLT